MRRAPSARRAPVQPAPADGKPGHPVPGRAAGLRRGGPCRGFPGCAFAGGRWSAPRLAQASMAPPPSPPRADPASGAGRLHPHSHSLGSGAQGQPSSGKPDGDCRGDSRAARWRAGTRHSASTGVLNRSGDPRGPGVGAGPGRAICRISGGWRQPRVSFGDCEGAQVPRGGGRVASQAVNYTAFQLCPRRPN